MNILLLNGLPEEFEDIPILTDFRNMIQVELALHDTELSEAERAYTIINLLYPEPPRDSKKAADGLVWFFTRGKIDANANGGKSDAKSKKRGFDFDQDADLIYAAFYATYHISLSTVDYLHWWEFMALFDGLPEETLIKRVIYWRTADLSKLPKEERKHVTKMRKLFALKQTGNKTPLTAEELNKQSIDRVAERYEAAQLAAEKKINSK